MTEKITPETWNKVWEKQQDSWDYLSEIIFSTLKKELGNAKDKLIIEAGSGSGRISQELSGISNNIFLLDYSSKALNTSNYFFTQKNLPHRGISGSIFQLPLKDNSFDVIWNAGVIEHYYEDEQHTFLKEAGRILKPGGLYITLNPYKKSVLHTLGKKFIEDRVEYPYGLEMPIESIKNPLGGTKLTLLKKEYSIGFIALFVGVFKRLQLLPRCSFFRFLKLY